MNHEAIVGCILGTAVGDAMGLPYEGLSPKRALRLLGPPDRFRFLCGRGMISDDTEHTCMVAQSLIEARGDVDVFAVQFANRLRWWILALPAGVGKATARSGVKLWLGAKPKTAGVFSAGNGPAMQAAILGVAIDDTSRMIEFVRASSRLNWPRSVEWMERLGNASADSFAAPSGTKAPTVHPIAVVLRNLIFLIVVLFHGFRRLAPPF